VYHANYLRYFERAREHLLGPDTLVALGRERGLGFVVYRCELRFREGAVFGDTLEVRSVATLQSPWRAVFSQKVHRGEKLLVEGTVEMVCVDATRTLVRMPDEVLHAMVVPPAG
jgi:YbgC/YbaW family acyl-CoA thioester hydrolase